MKKTIALLFTLLSLNLCKAEPPINLHLPKYNSNEDMVTLGLALAVSGAVLCTGAILEGNTSYNSAWKYDANGKMYQDTPPFLLQTPRQIYAISGAGISITGLVILFRNIKNR